MSNEKDQIIELLRWVNRIYVGEQLRFTNKDRWLDPEREMIVSARERQDGFLWIPNVEGLRALGFNLREQELENLRLLEVNGFFGAGVGEEEAALSALNQIRKQWAEFQL